MFSYIEKVESAIRELQQGKMIILIDHPDRENEGDLIMAAEKITAESMNFMVRHTSGIVCLSLPEAKLKQLHLPLMLPIYENTSLRGTPFTISIDATSNITTGVSAQDRATTILAAIDDHAKPEDLVKPGHIFPLQARPGGVLERAGHTEGALDLVQLAALKPAAVLCEVMNADGTMAHGKELDAFAKQHDLQVLSIDDIIAYRLYHENLIAEEISAHLPLDDYGSFQITIVKEKISGQEHVVLTKGNVEGEKSVLVRIHSACMTGDLFGSSRCDCKKQLDYALRRISVDGGMLIYLNQEGRGIGLFNKIKAYALQETGLDTIEANVKLNLPIDARKYDIAANILRNKNISSVRLLTNNPEKINDLKKYGIADVQREATPVFINEHNKDYLHTKNKKLKHEMEFV